MNKIIIAFFIVFLFIVKLCAHSGKPDYHVIIDTDGAVDDMRAISMFLAGNDIRVLAITCSQGSIMPDDIAIKVQSLLSAFHHEGIPVGVAESTDFELPPWAAFSRKIQWGDIDTVPATKVEPNAIALLNETIADYNNPLTLIALGSLETYANWLKSNPDVADKIERIIWYNTHDVTRGFNYKASPEGYEFIKKSKIRLEIVANNSRELIADSIYLKKIQETNSNYARQIRYVHEQKVISQPSTNIHLKLWDDLVPLYLNVPILFETRTSGCIRKVSLSKSMPVAFVHDAIHDLLISANQPGNRVYTAFPVDTVLYKPAYAAIVPETISRYGLTEWKAITLTNEIHGHSGIYSIIGAKMGIRALDYFNVGVNNLKVISFAGTRPPLSCLNDGVQISTGATIGQGLITISDSISKIPSAVFEFNNIKINISLKPGLAEQMQNQIKQAIGKYGLLTDAYWLCIEKLAIEYWSDFNRNEVFLIREL